MIICFSVSHNEAPLSIREKLNLTEPQLSNWLSREINAEVAVLSTCNRLELYVSSEDPSQAGTVWADLVNATSLSGENITEFTCTASGRDAASHLFRVASGLESAIIGEPQILGQVTAAFETANEHGKVGHALSLMFRSAIHAAKRVRTETHLDEGAVSFSSLGIRQSQLLYGSLEGEHVLVIGAGEMAQSAVKALVLRGLTNVTIVSRTFERAERLAEQWGVEAKPLEAIPHLMSQSRLVFSTTSTPEPVITPETIYDVLPSEDRALSLIDLAMPRDVHPDVNEIPGVTVFDLELLSTYIEDSLSRREQAVPEAATILEDELNHYWSDYRSREVVPTIKQIRSQAEAIRQAELERIINRLPESDEEDVQRLLEEFSHRLMNKILHQPTTALRAKAASDDGDRFTDVARDLFGLQG